MVRAGAELTGYEIRLQSAEVYRVRGVVLDSEGKPAAKAMAQLHARIAGGTPDAFFFAGGQGTFSIQNGPFASEPSELEPVVTGEYGVFEFPAVRAGEWSVQAESKPAGDEVRHRDIFSFGSATFSLGHADRDGITIQLAKPIDLSGDIVVGDGSPLPAGVLVAVSLYSENGRSSAAANTKGDGVLQFESVIPGAHEIRADVMAGNYHTESVLLGSNNITGQSVGISPGDYYAIALDHFDSRTMAEGVRLRSLMPMATSVRVEQGSAGSVQLRVHHAPD